jgi:biopolymer transport protein ExbB/TolQ
MTTETALLILLSTLMSVLIIISIAVMVLIYKLVSSARRVVQKAEDVVDSVESAADILKDTSGKMVFFKLLNNIIKTVQRSQK